MKHVSALAWLGIITAAIGVVTEFVLRNWAAVVWAFSALALWVGIALRDASDGYDATNP